MRYFILRDTAFLWISFEVKLFSFCFEYLGFCCIIQRKPYKRTHFSILHAHTRKEKRLTCVHRKSFLIYYTAIVTENYIHICNGTMNNNSLSTLYQKFCVCCIAKRYIFMNKNVGAFLMDSCMLLKIYFVQGLRNIQGKGRGSRKRIFLCVFFPIFILLKAIWYFSGNLKDLERSFYMHKQKFIAKYLLKLHFFVT